MRNQKTKALLFAVALGVSLFAQVSAKAQNPNYAPGDLVLAFQMEGGSNTVYVSLGNTTTFRGAATGVDVGNMINITNINTELNTAFSGTFGSWQANSNAIYAGLSGVANTSTGNGLTSGDPGRTLYVSAPRIDAGTVGEANSAAWEVDSDSSMTNGANAMVNQNNVLEVNYLTAAAVSPTGTSRIDDQNPFLAPGVQGLAFTIFDGGVQGIDGSFGSIGPVDNVVFALDLYRIQAKDSIAGQVGFGEGVRTGTYEGTIVVDNAGNVSFVTAVPEPTTSVLLAGGLTVLMTFRRRRQAAANA